LTINEKLLLPGETCIVKYLYHTTIFSDAHKIMLKEEEEEEKEY